MEVKMCERCILTDSIPGITFDRDGICNVCQKYFKKNDRKHERQADLGEILKTNSRKYKYDCLCLYSGGKDSTYMLYNLVDRYKLRVLAFTLDNWFLSDTTFANMNKVITKLKIDHMIYKPPHDLTLSLFKSGIEHSGKGASKDLAFLIGHVCWPCFAMISTFSIKTAIRHNIPNIVVGTTPGQLRQKSKNLLVKYSGVMDVYRTMVLPFLRILDAGQKRQLSLSFSEKIRALSLNLVPFYEYFQYSEKKAIDTATKVFNWEKPDDTDSCSSNCLINSLGIAIHKKLYNLNPYVIPLAHDVRIGVVEREEALKAVNSPLDHKIVLKTAGELGINGEKYV